MSNTMNTTVFKPIAPRPAPVNTEGPVAWVKANLSDWKTSMAHRRHWSCAALAGAPNPELGAVQSCRQPTTRPAGLKVPGPAGA